MPRGKDLVLKLAKGYKGRAKNCINIARGRVDKALQRAYLSRKLRKRDARSNWIQQINAAVRYHDLSYSRLVLGMSLSNMKLNRKMLAELANNEPLSFQAVVDQVKELNPDIRKTFQLSNFGHVQSVAVSLKQVIPPKRLPFWNYAPELVLPGDANSTTSASTASAQTAAAAAPATVPAGAR